MPTLGDRVAGVDAAHFVNRADELELLERMLEGGPQVALVHGPGGVGKSGLLREFARRAKSAGRAIHWLEGRELSPTPDALEDLVSEVRKVPRLLLILDSYERVEALGGYLRQTVLPSLPEDTLVVIAGRGVPGPEWREGGWEEVVAELRLGGLSDEASLEVLSRHGIEPNNTAHRIVGWAYGSPLALTLAAQAARQDPSWDGATGTEEIVKSIVGRLVDPELEPQHAQTLWVAAIARVTTAELLQDVLPHADAHEELRWLGARTFAETIGEGIGLHEVVADAIRQEVRQREPLRERELRQRICDHFYERASRGDLLLMIDLAYLSQTPEIRWGFAWQPATRFRLDDLRPGDAELIRSRLTRTSFEEPLAGTELFLEAAPEHVATVRDAQDRLRGYTIAVSPLDAPGFCAQDPLLGPRLEHARALPAPGRAILCREAIDLARETDPGVISMLGMGAVLRAAHGNPRWVYLPINPRLPGAVEFSRAQNGRRIDSLEARFGKTRVECHVIDYGSAGILGAQRDLIYRELGLAPPPARDTSPSLTPTVREALRNLDHPQVLASSDIARGTGLIERAASVRALIDEALEQAFSGTPGDQLTREALVLGYIRPSVSHETAAKQLSLSRAAYFRRLRRGVERVAEYIAAKHEATATDLDSLK